jgi:hypothetical protein
MTHVFEKCVVWQAGSSGNFIMAQNLPESEVVSLQANEYKIANNFKHFLRVSKELLPEQKILAAHPFPTQWLIENDVHVNELIMLKPSWFTELLLFTKRMLQYRTSPNDLVWMVQKIYYLSKGKEIDWHNFKDVIGLVRITERISEEFGLDVGGLQKQVTLCVLYMVWIRANNLEDNNDNLAKFITSEIIEPWNGKTIKHLDHEPYDVAEIELKNTGKVDNVYNVVYEDLFIDCNVVMGLNKSAVKEYSLKNIDILEKICTMAKHTDTLDRLSGYRARLEAVNG